MQQSVPASRQPFPVLPQRVPQLCDCCANEFHRATHDFDLTHLHSNVFHRPSKVFPRCVSTSVLGRPSLVRRAPEFFSMRRTFAMALRQGLVTPFQRVPIVLLLPPRSWNLLQRLARTAPELLTLERCCPALIIRSLRHPTPQIWHCQFEGRLRARRRPSRKGVDATYAVLSPTSSSVGATFSPAPPKSPQVVAMLRQQVPTVCNRFSDVSHSSPTVPQPRPIFHSMLQCLTRAAPRNSLRGPLGARASAREPRPSALRPRLRTPHGSPSSFASLPSQVQNPPNRFLGGLKPKKTLFGKFKT